MISKRVCISSAALVLGQVLTAGFCLALEKEVSLVTGQPIGELAVAGRLSVDLHAEFMVSRTYERDTVLNWYNCGYSGGGGCTTVGGDFGDFGFQVPFKEREEKYPHAVTVGKVRAVRFDGNDFLKGNFTAETNVVGMQDMALEVWLRAETPSIGKVVLGWQSKDGKEASAPLIFPSGFTGSDQWRHLIVNCTREKEEWYLDGVKVSGGKRRMIIKEGHVMVLGGATADKPSFKGDLAAVRLHDAAMSAEEIAHNCKGGVMLGTEMHSWWRLEPDTWWVKESEHFRHCVDKGEMAKWTGQQLKEFNERVPGMFALAELIYHTYSERLALRSSVVSIKPELRGDGIKYKTPIQPADGSFMGIDGNFGWACQGAGFINPHELVHGWDAHTGGMQGNYWEAHANFPQTYNGIYQTIPIIIAESSAFPASGRTYYHDRLMFEHLAQTPEYGPMFISKLWYDGPLKADASPYPWTTFSRINPYPERPLAEEYARMVMRNVTWDYKTFRERKVGEKGNTSYGNDGVVDEENLYRKAADNSKADIRRYARIILEKIPYEPESWRVPKEQAPQQLGWNICPLTFKPGRVSAALAGYVSPTRGSDWRAAFVGVDAKGKPVYGEVFGPGKAQSFEVTFEIKELYLVVCAVPTQIMAIDMVGDFRSFEQEQFPYKVKLTGCEPLDVMVPEKPAVSGAPHTNGGGFVEKTATVEASAYVGPQACVLGHSKVLGNARIEDFAMVRDATVKDDAVVSGHTLVTEDSTVAEQAKVRDFAVVKNRTTVKGNAKILEHGTIFTQKTCSDKVVVKGVASVYGGNQSGTAMLDGFYAKGNEITKGKWFTWSWGQGKNSGEADEEFGGLYADYDFESEHPWMARDAFGATWGYLVNAPKYEVCAERENRRSTLLKPEAFVQSFDQNQNAENDYAQQLSGYLLPPVTGDYTFWITADDEGELWLGEADSEKADRKLCSNPMWAGFREYGKFPSQKSAPVRLQKGKTYPIQVLHCNVHQGGSLSVSWIKPGSDKPEPLGVEQLAVAADGKQKGLRQRVWGGVATVAALVKRRDYPEGILRVSGQVLALNGKDQFVELPRDIADLREATYTVSFRWDGGQDGARVFEFANGNGDALWLSPSEKGSVVFAISKGGKVEQVATAKPLKKGVWVTAQVVVAGSRATLLLNGVKAAGNDKMTLHPDSIRATQCYLGRGLQGGYFGGLIDRFTVHSVSPDTE